MHLLLPAFLVIVLGTPSSPASLSPPYRSGFNGAKDALTEMSSHYQHTCLPDLLHAGEMLCSWTFLMNDSSEAVTDTAQTLVGDSLQEKTAEDKQAKDCNDSHDCPEDQYCHVSSLTAKCQECKPKEMHCQKDEECCSGMVCAWDSCIESLTADSGGTKCDPAMDNCAPGFCCYKPEALPFPVCMPFLSRGMPCQSQTSDILKWINFRADYKFDLGRCPCAEGLVCTSKGNLISTCERPDEVIDFTNYRGDSLFPPLVRRDDEFIYYDTDLVPWPSQDEQLAFIDFPRAAEESEREARNALNTLSLDIDDDLEDESLHFDNLVDEAADPSQDDFQELRQLANDMGQYFGPGLY